VDKKSPIKELREKIGISQRELADTLGVHHSYIANLENNLINIEEEDEEDDETQTRLLDIFEQLAEWSGESAEELIRKQNEATRETVESMKAEVSSKINQQVMQQISQIAEDLGVSRDMSEDEAAYLIDIGFISSGSMVDTKSPIKMIRDWAGITQRQLAQAADVSQAYIARVERGELALSGPNTGLRLVNFIIEALGVTDLDSPAYDTLFHQLLELQEKFIEMNKARTKVKVKAAFEKLKKGKGAEGKDS
jgi:predicted transcriptional regulator